MKSKQHRIPLAEYHRLKILEDLIQVTDVQLSIMLKQHSEWLVGLSTKDFVSGRAAASMQIRNYLNDKRRIQ
jgi:hypothetical protein